MKRTKKKRKHVKAFQDEQYNVADKRMCNNTEWAEMLLIAPYNSNTLRVFPEIKKYQLI